MDDNNEPMNLDFYLKSLEDMHNSPEGNEPDEVGINRVLYINELLKQNFIPTEELLKLFRVYMNGKEDSWWCKSTLTFREFLNFLRAADLRKGRYEKSYRRGFSDGIRFILDAIAD